MIVVFLILFYAWLGENLPEFSMAKLREVPDEFWINLGLGVGKVLGLVIAAMIVLRILRYAKVSTWAITPEPVSYRCC